MARRRSHLGAPAAFRKGVRHQLARGLALARKGRCAEAYHAIKGASKQMTYLTMRPQYMDDADQSLMFKVDQVKRRFKSACPKGTY